MLIKHFFHLYFFHNINIFLQPFGSYHHQSCYSLKKSLNYVYTYFFSSKFLNFKENILKLFLQYLKILNKSFIDKLKAIENFKKMV